MKYCSLGFVNFGAVTQILAHEVFIVVQLTSLAYRQ